MIDVMSALKERKAKAEAKVARAAKALESARKELMDIYAAERVIVDITGESAAPKAPEGLVSERDRLIARLLPDEREKAIGPADLLPIYEQNKGDPINLDAFRTAVWRLQKKVIPGDTKTWVVKSEAGKYWRQVLPDSPDADETQSGEGEIDFEELLGGDDDSIPY